MHARDHPFAEAAIQEQITVSITNRCMSASSMKSRVTDTRIEYMQRQCTCEAGSTEIRKRAGHLLEAGCLVDGWAPDISRHDGLEADGTVLGKWSTNLPDGTSQQISLNHVHSHDW